MHTTHRLSLVALFAFLVCTAAPAGEVAGNYNCTANSDPERLVKSFAERGLIEPKAYAENDSISYFKANPGGTAFGYPLVAVAAFKEESSFFHRAPGTSPGNRFALVVQAAEQQILNVVHAKGLTVAGARELRYPMLRVESFNKELSEPLPRGSSPRQVYTQIICLPKV